MSKLLAYLRAGGDAQISTISRKLEIDEGTVVMLLDQLVKMGYLEPIDDEKPDDTCSTIKCNGCSKATNCESLLTIKYKLVDKK